MRPFQGPRPSSVSQGMQYARPAAYLVTLHAPQCATQVFLFIRIYLRSLEIRRIEAFRGPISESPPPRPLTRGHFQFAPQQLATGSRRSIIALSFQPQREPR